MGTEPRTEPTAEPDAESLWNRVDDGTLEVAVGDDPDVIEMRMSRTVHDRILAAIEAAPVPDALTEVLNALEALRTEIIVGTAARSAALPMAETILRKQGRLT